jgi:hypothetical protein
MVLAGTPLACPSPRVGPIGITRGWCRLPASSTRSVTVPTEVLFHVDLLITCAAPDVEVPDAFSGPKFNMLLARGARLIGPRLAFTVLFEVNAVDENEAKLKAADAVKEVLDSLDRQKPDDKTLPDELDLHEDRIVVAGLAVRRVAGVPDAEKTA